MGGGSQTQSSGPPKWMVPYIQDVMNQGKNLYNNYTPQYFPDSTVAPQSGATKSGIEALGGFGSNLMNQAATNAAVGGSATLSGASNPNTNPVYGAGAAMTPGSLSYLQGVQGSSPTQIEGLGSATGANTAAAINSQLTAAPGSNPWVDQMVARALGANTRNFLQQAMPSIDGGADLAGGYGGTRQGIAQGIALQSLGDANARTAADLYASQYNQDAARQLQAAGLGANVASNASSAGLERTGQGITASGMGLDLLQTGYGQGLDAAKANVALAPGVQQVGLTPINAQLGAGAMSDQYNQALVQDAMNRWNFQQDLPYNKLNEYANLVTGGAGTAGQRTSGSGGGTSVVGAAGGAMAGLATSAMIYGSANAWNPVGWGLMAFGALAGSGILG